MKVEPTAKPVRNKEILGSPKRDAFEIFLKMA